MPFIINDRVIGNHIRAARERKRLSQAKCAALMDISVSYFGRLERGVVRINIEKLLEISSLLDVSAADLLDHCCEQVSESIPSSPQNGYAEEIMKMVDTTSAQTIEMMYELCKTAYQKLEHKKSR